MDGKRLVICTEFDPSVETHSVADLFAGNKTLKENPLLEILLKSTGKMLGMELQNKTKRNKRKGGYVRTYENNYHRRVTFFSNS